MDGSSNADGSYGNGVGFADANGLEEISNANGKDYGNGIGFEDANGIDSVDGSFIHPKEIFIVQKEISTMQMEILRCRWRFL